MTETGSGTALGKLVARHGEADDRTWTREGKIVGSGDQRMRELGNEECSQ